MKIVYQKLRKQTTKKGESKRKNILMKTEAILVSQLQKQPLFLEKEQCARFCQHYEIGQQKRKTFFKITLFSYL